MAGRTGLAGLTAAWERAAWPAGVLLVLALGAALRFGGIGWDIPAGTTTPLQMHPDERFISIVNEKIEWPGAGQYFDTSSSSLNPYNQPDTPSFVYGTFPIFLAKAVASAAGSDVPGISQAAGVLCGRDGYDTTILCGRKLTALTDTLTIALVIALATLFLGRGPGLLAGLLYACAVLPIQLSHFWTVDPYVVFFGVAVALLSLLWVLERAARPARGERGRLRALRENARPIALLGGIGLCVGLGLASKVTAWPLVLAPGIALAIRCGIREWPQLGLTVNGRRPIVGGHWSYDVMAMTAAALLALVVFRVAQPYAFSGPHFWDMAINPTWRADIEREIDFQNGNVDYPPFVQFAGRARLLWPLSNIAIWALGPALSLAAFAGAVGAGVVAARRRDMAWLIPLAMVAAVVGFQGLRFVAYMRYFAPAFPFLAIFAAGAAAWLWRAGRGQTEAATGIWGRVSRGMLPREGRRRRALKGAAIALAIAVPALTAWWAFAYNTVVQQKHPRIEASEWIYANVPPGSAVTTEIWDDSLPYYLPGRSPAEYQIVNTYPFETDSVAKVVALIYGSEGPNNPGVGLNGADYVILASDRVRHAVRQMEREYPATILYYQLLDSGELGFELVAEFSANPSFLGVSVDDSAAEESFTVYDHPTVRIYRKTEAWDPNRALNLLLEAHPERAVNLLPRQGGVNGLQFTADEWEQAQAGGTFSETFSDSGPFATATWLWWFAWVQVLAFSTVPWLTWLFRRLPDRGYGLSKLAGFAGAGLVTWLLVAWGVFTFSQALAGGVALAFVATGVVTATIRREALAAEFRTRWATWLGCELAFLAAFGFFLALRFELPDLWHNWQGGEKPVELAFLTAIARSETMPPYDPWYAGGTMNYYYMGWFLAAVPMKAMRILPEVGFNLAIPTYAGLAAATAYSTAANLAGLGPRVSHRVSRRSVVTAGVLGALLLVGIGNLDAGHQAILRFQQLNISGYHPTGEPTYHWGLFSDLPFLGGLVGTLSGVYRWLFADAMLPAFDWWRPSRVHAPAFDITEFPFFSFLFGDLHAHLMGIPFFGLVIALCLAYVVSCERDGFRAWLIAAAMGIAMGLVRTVHTWDLATAVLLVYTAIAAGQFLREDRWQTRTWDGIGHAFVAGVVLVMLFAPYTQHAAVSETGLVLARETTKANQYFAHFGLFIVILVAFLAVRYHEELSARPLGPGNNPVLAALGGKLEVISFATFCMGLSAFTWRWGLTTIALSTLLLVLLGNLLFLEVRARERNLPRLFATGLFFVAVGVAGGVDVVQVEYDIVRMNTVFKFSLQAWQVFAVASAYGLLYVASALGSIDNWYVRIRPGRRFAAASATAAIGVLLIGSSLYVWSGTRARLTARFENSPSGTLDGLAYLPYGYYGEDMGTQDPSDDVLILLRDDLPIIEWLRENVEGSPVVAEAVGPLYHWTSRISWNTGLPTVIGWDWHEVAYRTEYEFSVQVRRVETQQFYGDPSQRLARDYLRRYDVSYVVVGTTERVFGTPEGLAKFDAMPQLEVVFREGDAVIYRVNKELLGPASLVSR